MKWFKHGLITLIVMAFIAIDIQAATLKSVIVTNADASPPTMNNPNVDGGAVRRKKGVYVFTGSEATADIVEMVKMPRGSIIIRELSTIAWDDMGGTVTVEVGDVDDPNRYATSLAMGTVGSARVTFEEAIGIGLPVDENIVGTATTNDTVDLTLTTVSTPTSGSKVMVEVVYVSGG